MGEKRWNGWEQLRDANSAKAVMYECGVSWSTEKWLCQFPRNDLVVLLDKTLH